VTEARSIRDRLIREIRFVDGHAEIWRVFEDAALFRDVVEAVASPWASLPPVKVAGVEARGFILGAAVAQALGAGFVAIRKSGSLFAGAKVEATAEPDYRGVRHRLRLRRESIVRGDRVMLVDDWCEVGAQALAATSLLESCGATVLGLSVIVDQAPPPIHGAFRRFEALVRGDELDES
jgi:adenine phosphoribosyltransferase